MLGKTHKAFGLAVTTVTLVAVHSQVTIPEGGLLDTAGQIIATETLAAGLTWIPGNIKRIKAGIRELAPRKANKIIAVICLTGLLGVAAIAQSLIPGMLIILMAGVLGSRLPDIDQVLGHTHRGFTHAVWIPIALLLTAWKTKTVMVPYIQIPLWSAMAFGCGIGWMSHLFGDAFSEAGIAWFYPLQQYVREPSGAFYVKGNRGPFLPLYTVGDSCYEIIPIVWYAAAIALSGYWAVIV